jgi:hypothetical protein
MLEDVKRRRRPRRLWLGSVQRTKKVDESCYPAAGAPPRGSLFIASLGGREERWKIHKAGLTVSACLTGSRFVCPTNQREAHIRWPGHLMVINAEKGFHPLQKKKEGVSSTILGRCKHDPKIINCKLTDTTLR